MTYIDGFVVPVPTASKAAYKKHAELGAQVFKDCGATRVVECWGDDVPKGKVTSFQMAVKGKEDETIVFAWIVWPSKDARDAGIKKAMEDERLHPDNNPMPFDGMRMIYGGFEPLIDT